MTQAVDSQPPAPHQPRNPAVGADLVPQVDELMRLRAVAAGTAEADLIVRGGIVVSLHSGELLERDVVIAGRHIAAVTPVARHCGRTWPAGCPTTTTRSPPTRCWIGCASGR